MPPLSLQRKPALNYHYEEGRAWLENSAVGANTTALSYAAFEFRLAIERIGLQYWNALIPDGLEVNDLREARSFKRIENRIYQLAGHQKEIDMRFEFGRIVLALLKIDLLLVTPNLRQLSRFWHECSEVCHVAWSLASLNREFAKKSYEALEAICEFLREQVNGLLTWGTVVDSPFRELEAKFVAGQATAEDVRRHLEERGVWARIEYNDGRPSAFIGEAIPPRTKTEGS